MGAISWLLFFGCAGGAGVALMYAVTGLCNIARKPRRKGVQRAEMPISRVEYVDGYFRVSNR